MTETARIMRQPRKGSSMDQIDLSDEEIVFLWQRGIAVYLKLETEEESKRHTREQIKTIIKKNMRRAFPTEPKTCETCAIPYCEQYGEPCPNWTNGAAMDRIEDGETK